MSDYGCKAGQRLNLRMVRHCQTNGQRGNRTLEQVRYKHGNPGPRPENTDSVGGAHASAAMQEEVFLKHIAPDQISNRNRTDQVGQDQKRDSHDNF
jgi:hypothetical protein